MVSDRTIFRNRPYLEQFGDGFPQLRGFAKKAPGNLQFVNRISFQLSNLCNYSVLHKKCPLSQVTCKQILSSKVIDNVLGELGQHVFQGLIGFHIYNEPMIDPRLFLFIQKSKYACPNSKCLILTNGFYLTDTMITELEDIGVDMLHVSAYTSSEYDRFMGLNNDSLPLCILPMNLDNRLDLYNRDERNINTPCSAPLNEICIAPTGKVILCCLDWQSMHEFGNLHQQTLTDIVNSQSVTKVADQLARGQRMLHLCKRCDWSR